MEFEFLIQQSPNLSIKEAEKNLCHLLQLLGIKINNKSRVNQTINKFNKDKKIVKSYSFLELRNEIRENGICELHSDLDNLDPIFDHQFNPSTNSSALTITVEWEGYKTEIKGPCIITPSEWALSDDIEFYKSETCIEFNSNNFEMGARNYRGFLFSCIALIDAYINRHIKYSESKKISSEKFKQLQLSKRIEDRIKLFAEIYCNSNFYEINKTEEWNNFKKLHKLRNNIIHSTEPHLGLGLKEISEYLNLSIKGIGGLIKILQESQNKHTLKFIEKVRNSSIIHFKNYFADKNGKTKTKIEYRKIKR